MMDKMHRIFERFAVSRNVLQQENNENGMDDTRTELNEVCKVLERIEKIIEALEKDDDSVQAEAEALLRYYGPEKRAEMQEWCQNVQMKRAEVPSIAHQRPIFKMKFIEASAINDEAHRKFIVEKFGFRFESFSEVLDKIDFWQRVGPALEQQGLLEKGTDWSLYHFLPEDDMFPVLVNVLNGGAPVDYEGLFPEAQEIFALLKQRKLHLNEKTPQQPSTLSVPDILTAVIFEKFIHDIPEDKKKEVTELNLSLVDDIISNEDRIDAYEKLVVISADILFSQENAKFSELINMAGDELGVPEHHIASLPSLEFIRQKWGTVDAVVVLKHFDLARTGYIARSFLQEFPEAFAIPSGMFTPHEMKEGEQKARAEYTEADETISWLLSENFKDPFARLPHMPSLGEYPPVEPSDILIPDEYSIDTAGNAQHVARRLKALHEVRGKVLNVVILTTDFHGSRAYADFRSVISESEVSNLGVYEYKNSPPIANIGTERKIVGIMDMFCEYAKRLYMVATQK